MQLIERIWRQAGYGLDPDDGLTAEEALARILCLCAIAQSTSIQEAEETPVEEFYRDDPLIGGPIVPVLLRWENGEREFRDRLERAGLIHS